MKHLEECHEKIYLDVTYVQHPLCQKDVAIMDLVNNQTTQKMTTNQNEKLNCVQMYLGVQYVSQICAVDENNVFQEYLTETTDIYANVRN